MRRLLLPDKQLFLDGDARHDRLAFWQIGTGRRWDTLELPAVGLD